MVPPRKHVSQAPAAIPASSKGKGKAVEVAEPASHPNLSDIHIADAEDSQSSSTLPQRALIVVLEPQHTDKQLLQMLPNLQNQLEEQHTEMGQLREAAALEKDSISCPDQTHQASRHTTKIAISSNCRRKSSGSPVAAM